jgi:hypothetical protein
VKRQILLVFMMLLFATNLASAQSTPAPPVPSWQGQYTVRANLPFVWVRNDPSSSGSVSETLSAGTRVTASMPPSGDARPALSYDGVQWWGYVQSPRSFGWVEIASLVLVDPNAPPTPTPNGPTSAQRWAVGNVVRVRASVPFVYVRADPGSTQVAGTVLTGGRFVVLGDAMRDASIPTTFWRQVREAANNGATVGWVEEASLEFVRARANFRLPPLPGDFWRPGFIMRVKASLPFAWMRSTASSNAPIVYTLQPGATVTLGSDLVWDGVQNWRAVGVRGTPYNGYIEESALEFLRLFTLF